MNNFKIVYKGGFVVFYSPSTRMIDVSDIVSILKLDDTTALYKKDAYKIRTKYEDFKVHLTTEEYDLLIENIISNRSSNNKKISIIK